jgi:uroporphyrinogen decarboxylase
MAYDNPGFVEELMHMIHKWEMQRLQRILDFGVDMIYATGCYETAPLWSPDLFDKWFAPLITEEVKITHQAGAKFSYFSTGSFTPHFHTLKSSGVDVLSAILPPPGGDNDMRVAKEEVGDEICLWGGIDPVYVIEKGTKEIVRREVMDVIQVAAPGGGFVLSTGGSIYDKDCYENVITFIETAREFGTYPIDIQTSPINANL